MTTVIELLLWVALVPVLLAAVYLGLLTLCSRVPAAPPPGGLRTRFDLVVPAHDEEAGIARTVTALRALRYPAAGFRVLVVADNCTDRTAELASAAGALTLVRQDPERRGKGYALEHAFARSRADGFADAVVVVDADTLPDPELLRAFDARLEAGAQAIQADYAVLNPHASWRTRLMAVAFGAFHGVRSLARERLGLSAGLRGNGMCFRAELLQRVPPRAYSVVEDIEYGILLGMNRVRVAYAHEARVYGEMVASEGASRSQRVRWEAGRKALRQEWLRPLLRSAVRERDPVRLDLALDLLVPQLATLAAGVAVAAVACATTAFFWGTAPTAAIGVAVAGLLLVAHVARGWQLSQMGWSGLTALAYVPVYVLWKLRLLARGTNHKNGWVRTARGEAAR